MEYMTFQLTDTQLTAVRLPRCAGAAQVLRRLTRVVALHGAHLPPFCHSILKWHVEVQVLEADPTFPVAAFHKFHVCMLLHLGPRRPLFPRPLFHPAGA